MPCETRPNREHFARGGVRESAACDTPLVARALRTRNYAWHDKKQNAARGRATGLNYCTTELSEAGRQFNDGIHQGSLRPGIEAGRKLTATVACFDYAHMMAGNPLYDDQGHMTGHTRITVKTGETPRGVQVPKVRATLRWREMDSNF
jgi:hypothetical protein